MTVYREIKLQENTYVGQSSRLVGNQAKLIGQVSSEVERSKGGARLGVGGGSGRGGITHIHRGTWDVRWVRLAPECALVAGAYHARTGTLRRSQTLPAA